MDYEKHNFVDGQVLYAQDLNEIEDNIENITTDLNELVLSIVEGTEDIIISGKGIAGNEGGEISYSTFVCTDYIDISSRALNNSISFTCLLSGWIGWAFYDENKFYIDGVCGNTATEKGYPFGTFQTYVVKPPINAKYIRISHRTDYGYTQPSDFVVKFLSADVSKADLEETNAHIDYVETLVNNGGIVVSPTDWKLGYIHTATSIVEDGRTVVSGLTNVEVGDTFRINNADYHFIIVNNDSGHTLFINSFVSEYTFNQNGAFYFEIRKKNNTSITDTSPFDGMITSSRTLPYIEDLKEDNKYFEIFRNVAIIGDSLSSGELVINNALVDTYTESWLSFLCKRNGVNCEHFSKGGLTTKSWLENTSGKRVAFENDNVVRDVYFIALGSNDKNASFPIGSASDSISAESFCGYYKNIIDLIHTKNPYAKIMLVSLYQITDIAKNYSSKISEIADLYDYCYFIDFVGNADGTIIIQGVNTPFINDSHYTCIGYKKVSAVIERVVDKVISDNFNDFRFIGYYN